MSKNQIIKLVVVVLIVVGLGFWAYKVSENVGYSVVYFATGEVYVGKLTTFPDLKLTDSYILQVTQDAADKTKSNFQLQPIKDALWAPKSIHIVKDNVVFYGSLLSESIIAKKLAEQIK